MQLMQIDCGNPGETLQFSRSNCEAILKIQFLCKARKSKSKFMKSTEFCIGVYQLLYAQDFFCVFFMNY